MSGFALRRSLLYNFKHFGFKIICTHKRLPKMNSLAVVVWCLIFTVAAGNGLNVSDIRLVNGTGPYGGRVEIQINGIWGTVCDDYFDFNDAKVMCRMMNLKASTYMTGARYGQGIGPTFARFHCRGYESHFKYCSFVSNVQCTHARDIGLICSECPDINIGNGYGVDISADGTVLSAMCKNGFSSNATSTCTNGIWSPRSIICKRDITDIRLVNGTGLYDGRIELLVNGTWGTLCSTSFSSSEAGVICRTFAGTTSSYRTYRTSSSDYGPGTGPIHIDNLDCAGSETNINECSYSLDVSCTDHSRDVAVACNVQHLNITATRLVNGTGPYDGRIELYVDGHWGTICNRNIGVYDAQTICSTHNASLVLHFTKTRFGKGTGPVLIGDINCYSHRDHVNKCRIYSPYRSYCTHDYDLSIVCTPCGRPKIYNGEPFSFNNTELTVKCQEGFFPDYIKMRCTNNGTWVENKRCTSYDAYPLDISELRLRNGYGYSHQGRVELFVNGTWGTVCDTEFDSSDAAVLCRMLDLEYKGFYINAYYFGKGSGTIFVDNLHCNGTEQHINNCTYEISNNCTHDDDVGVVCTGYQLNITDIRLAGTNGPYHGRVEIEVDGVWGTVCDYYFSGARTLCRMLGLEYKTSYYNAKYGQGSGPIYLYNLRCPYSATHINECAYNTNNYFNCDHGDDVSVVCYGPRLNITDARLVNGTGPYDGRAEIKVGATWGTICDTNFEIVDADYFCRMLGLRAVHFRTGAFYGKGSGPVFIDQLYCNKYDRDLSDCQYVFLNECSHERDVSVVCNECGHTDISQWAAAELTYNGTTLFADCSHYKTLLGTLKLTCNRDTQIWETEGECQEYSYPLNITGIRLSNGSGPSQGRVEIKSLNTWGTICGDNFGISEANLICRMVGYKRALSFLTGAFYGEGKGPIFADDLDCKENAFDFNDCTYKTNDDCSHGDDISVVCTDCGQTDISSWNARYLTYNGTTMYADCTYNKTLLGTLILTCNRDTQIWEKEAECQKYSYPLNITDIRLADGPLPSQGRVEIKSLNTWGTICDDEFGILEANLICRMVGYIHALSFHTGAFYGKGKGPIFADNLACKENAIDFNDCTYKTHDDCSHGEDISVVCSDIDKGCADPTPKHGLVNTSSTSYETAVYVTCEKGYKLIGEENIVCQPNGTWTNQPACKLIDCGNATPKNGFVNTVSTTYQSVVHVTCNEGYNLIGEKYIICQPNATWSNRPVCKLIDCGDPTPVHGSSNSSVTTNGTAVLITCKTGYTMIGESIITCQSDGAWTGAPSCVINDCGDPTPKNGFVNTSSTTFQTGVHVTCEKDYKLIGEEHIICQPNATWSTRPVCKLIDCGDPTPVHGSSNSSVTTNGTVALIECETGYTIIGESIITCQPDETWTGAPSCVIQDCGEATVKNGFVNTLSTTYQSVVHVTCDKGYKLIGKEYIICQANSTWSNRPVCKLINCGDPTPLHGSSNSSDTTNGTVALIECETGYTMIGKSIITCQQDETWTDTPSCFIKEKTVGDDTKVIISVTVSVGILVVAIIGLATVILFRKRNSIAKTSVNNTATAGTKAGTDHIYDDPTNIQRTNTESGIETHVYTSIRNEDSQQISMKHLDNDMLIPKEEHDPIFYHQTQTTKETHFYENFPSQ